MKTDLSKNKLFFLVGCFGCRLILAYVSKTIDIKYLPYIGYGCGIISICFAIIFLFKLRKSGPENRNIWWNNLRPVHSILYGLFAYHAINKKKYSWIFLMIDALFGLSMYLIFNFTKYRFF